MVDDDTLVQSSPLTASLLDAVQRMAQHIKALEAENKCLLAELQDLKTHGDFSPTLGIGWSEKYL